MAMLFQKLKILQIVIKKVLSYSTETHLFVLYLFIIFFCLVSTIEQSTSDSGDFTGSIIEEDFAEEEEEGLIFTGERINGRPVIKGGNIEKLVERLTYHKFNGTILYSYLYLLFSYFSFQM